MEARYLFSGEPPVPLVDWQSAIFDDGVSGTLPVLFSRNTATVDRQGNTVGLNLPRFGDSRLLTDIDSWSMVLADTGQAEIFGSGWDHDGESPLAILWDVSQHELTFVRGDNFTVVNTLNTNSGLLAGTVPGYRYIPQNAIVYEGLVAVLMQRERRVGSSWVVEGVSFASTQDYGQTFQRIEQVGGGYDVPAIAGA